MPEQFLKTGGAIVCILVLLKIITSNCCPMLQSKGGNRGGKGGDNRGNKCYKNKRLTFACYFLQNKGKVQK
jgi:hypothetical protein